MSKTRLDAALSRAAALLHAGRLDEAETARGRELDRDRRNVAALHLLGLIATTRGRLDDAARLHERGLRVDADAANHLCSLAHVRTMQGRYDEAIALADRALGKDPRHPAALAAKADALERRGDLDAARALLAPLVDAGAEDAETALLYATLLDRGGGTAEALALVERHLAGSGLAPITTQKLLYFAGWAHERLGACDAAFETFARADALVPGAYDHEAERRRTDRIIETFGPERLGTLARARTTTDLPVVIASMPRTGSTLVEQILAAHPDVHGAGEIEALPALARGLPHELRSRRAYPEIVADLTTAAADRLGRRYVGRLRQLDRAALRVTDKSLRNDRLLGLVALIAPGTRVVWCRRHPLDTCLSCFMHPLAPAVMPWSTDLRAAGAHQREHDRLMRHWADVLDLPLHEVSYERLVADPEAETRALIDFCGLAWSDECLRFHASGRAVATLSYDQVRRPLYRTAAGRYERYAKHLGPLREALALEQGADVDGAPDERKNS